MKLKKEEEEEDEISNHKHEYYCTVTIKSERIRKHTQ